MARLRRLVRHASHRREAGLVVVEGEKVIRAALEAGVELAELYQGPGGSEALISEASRAGARVWQLDASVLARVASTVTPQPDIALFARPAPAIADLDGDLVLVGVGIQDPGNAGTMVRTALAAGAAGIVFCEGSVDVFSPKTVRSSAGSVFALPVLTTERAAEALEGLRAGGYQLVGTAVAGDDELWDVEMEGRIAMVMGSEAAGLPDEVVAELDATVRIPMAGGESLNVSAAAAVVLFEAARRKRKAAR